jgi:hypothetical protein
MGASIIKGPGIVCQKLFCSLLVLGVSVINYMRIGATEDEVVDAYAFRDLPEVVGNKHRYNILQIFGDRHHTESPSRGKDHKHN